MKTTAEIAAEIRVLSLQLAQQMGEIPWEEDYGSPFAAIEARAAEIGDMMMREIVAQRTRMQNETKLAQSKCCCPKCNDPGELKQPRKRELQTIRGTIELTEPEYYCNKCRRSFFPSDALDRS
jgi:uncharacterized protein with PIN domain